MKEEIDYLEKKVSQDVLLNIELAQQIGLFCRNPGLHVVPAYDMLLQEGLQNRIDRIREKLVQNSGNIDKKEFYKAELILLKSFQKLIIRYGVEAEKNYKQSIYNNLNLIRIADACKAIAYEPPRTFFEAVQLLLFAQESVISEAGSGSISLGRIDQYLYPFYKKDIEEGRMSKEEAQNIIIALWKKLSNMELSWQNITIGGSDKFGNDMCNDLTIMCMNASLVVRADQPQLSLRVHKNMPENIWSKAFELMKEGMGFPALHNDRVAVKTKINAGLTEEDAWNYSVMGCVELMVGGKEYSHTEGARINWVKILELILNENQCVITQSKGILQENHKLSEFDNFEEFYSWYKREFVHVTKIICKYIDMANEEYGKRWQTPFTSSLMHGCIEKGTDVTDGGTIYNNLCVNCVGFASTVDSLEAIEELVFKKKIISLQEYAIALKCNFKGYEDLQIKARSCDKYGNDKFKVDKKAEELAALFINTLKSTPLRSRDGGVFQAGFYTSYFHSDFGKITGATPDGRNAKKPLSSSLSAMTGADINGPTALINSVNRIKMDRFSNGMALDLRFSKSFLEKESHMKAVKVLIEEYFENGGLEIQFNVIDKDVLLEAQRNPIAYADLMVRVSGFSAYFRNLDKDLQDEIIHRTEHEGC